MGGRLRGRGCRAERHSKRDLLDQMQGDCPANTRTQLADFTANSMVELKSAGVEATPTEILSDVRESSSLQVSDCLQLFAAYVLIKKDTG